MNRLTLLKNTGEINRFGGYTYGVYQCTCGAIVTVLNCKVKSGNTKSCGCLVKETRVNSKKTHGLRYHPLYHVWLNMKQRCTNPKLKCYKYYGGAGIKVCDRWQSFENFYADVSAGYAEGLELDRKIDFGDYEPNNVRWIPHKRNSQRRRYCKLSYAKAKRIRESNKSVEVLAAQFNVSEGSIRQVLKNRTWAH